MHTDKPVTDYTLDRFQRYNFAKRIAQTILNRPANDSLTIGLYGQWGEGKTSVIEFICRELGQETIVVRFNPWQFVGEQALLSSFFGQLADVLSVKLEGWRDKAGKLVKDYGAIFSTVPYVSKDATEALGNILSKATLSSQRKAVIDALMETDQPVVVFIDDIDRLESTEIQAVFKLVKSVADFPNIIYVLALDPARIADALKPTFGDGQAYLEKIIQVPLTLPKAQPAALRQYTYELINRALNQPDLTISEDELRFHKSNFEKYLAHFVKSPRDPARISNAIMFALPMLNGEVHVGDLMLLETLKVLQPILYHSIRASSSIYLRTYSSYGYSNDYQDREAKKKEAKALIDSHLSYLSDTDRKTIFPLLEELFPQLETLYSNIVYANDDRYKKWHQQKRLCSGHHFDRYFTYAVIEGQISDVLFNDLLATLDSKSLDATVNHFDRALIGLDATDFAYKLSYFDGSFTPEEAAQMARVLSRLGARFYVESGSNFSSMSPVVSLIEKYIALQNEANRGLLTEELIEIITPVVLALHLHDAFWHHGRQENSEDTILKKEQLVCVEQKLFKRLLTKVGQLEMFTEFDEGLLSNVLHAWVQNGHNTTELKERTNRLLDDHRNFGLKLISIMAPTVYSSRSNKRETTRDHIKSELTQEDYNLLWNIVSVDKLYEQTVKQYGTQTYVLAETSDRYTELTDMELIGQFQQMYTKGG